MFLWVDPWIRKLWFAIADKDKNIYELWAIINELDGWRKDNARRLYEISDFFDSLLEKYDITSVCMEKIFFTKFNQSNAEFVYGVRWLLLSKFFEKKINIIELTPNEIKKQITWIWTAWKENMQKTIKKIYDLAELPEPHDAADALGMAYIASKRF